MIAPSVSAWVVFAAILRPSFAIAMKSVDLYSADGAGCETNEYVKGLSRGEQDGLGFVGGCD